MINFNNLAYFIAIFSLCFAAVAWGGSFIVFKSVLFVINPVYLTAIRYVFSAIIFAGVLLISEGWSSFNLGKKYLSLFVYATLGFAGTSLFSLYGLKYTRPEIGAVIMACQPLIAIIINQVFFKLKPSSITVKCVIASLIGVFLVITNGTCNFYSTNKEIFGDILVLLGAISWVIYSFGAKEYKEWSPLRYTTLTCIVSIIPISLITLCVTLGGFVSMPSSKVISIMAPDLFYIVIIASVGAFICWNHGIKIVGTLNGVLFVNLIPIVTLAISIVQRIPTTFLKVMGVCIVVSALTINNLMTRMLQT